MATLVRSICASVQKSEMYSIVVDETKDPVSKSNYILLFNTFMLTKQKVSLHSFLLGILMLKACPSTFLIH